MIDIDILNENEMTTLSGLISNSGRIVICCHKSPDGDALGSSLAWAEYLKAKGKESVVVLIPDAYPDFLRWLPNTEKIVRYDKHRERGDKLLNEADVIFCLDFNEAGRVDDMQASLEASPAKKVMIDHHLNPSMPSAALVVSHPEACSTSELIFRLIWQSGDFDLMDKKMAASVYCGMMTDTGGFTYNSTRPEIYAIIGQLLTKRIDKDKIYRNVYNNFSHWAIRLRGYIMFQKLNVLSDKHASYFTITRKDMLNFHFVKGDAEGLVNEPLKIKGMRLSISLREDDRKDNLIWVSLRSVDDFPCNKLAAAYFNGGGHLNASGGRLLCTMDEAVRITREAIMNFTY